MRFHWGIAPFSSEPYPWPLQVMTAVKQPLQTERPLPP
jgi:hypothetical protein